MIDPINSHPTQASYDTCSNIRSFIRLGCRITDSINLGTQNKSQGASWLKKTCILSGLLIIGLIALKLFSTFFPNRTTTPTKQDDPLPPKPSTTPEEKHPFYPDNRFYTHFPTVPKETDFSHFLHQQLQEATDLAAVKKIIDEYRIYIVNNYLTIHINLKAFPKEKAGWISSTIASGSSSNDFIDTTKPVSSTELTCCSPSKLISITLGTLKNIEERAKFEQQLTAYLDSLPSYQNQEEIQSYFKTQLEQNYTKFSLNQKTWITTCLFHRFICNTAENITFPSLQGNRFLEKFLYSKLSSTDFIQFAKTHFDEASNKDMFLQVADECDAFINMIEEMSIKLSYVGYYVSVMQTFAGTEKLKWIEEIIAKKKSSII